MKPRLELIEIQREQAGKILIILLFLTSKIIRINQFLKKVNLPILQKKLNCLIVVKKSKRLIVVKKPKRLILTKKSKHQILLDPPIQMGIGLMLSKILILKITEAGETTVGGFVVYSPVLEVRIMYKRLSLEAIGETKLSET